MARIAFDATLQKPDGNGTAFFEVPLDVREAFGRARPPVVVHLNDYTFRTTIAVYGGKYFVGINRAHADAAGVGPGSTVRIEIEPDDEARTVEVPEDLRAALATEPELERHFQGLAYTHRLEYVRWIEEAKRPETRGRRIAETLDRLFERTSSRR